MSDRHRDAGFDRPLQTREGWRLRTLRGAYDFVCGRWAYSGHPRVGWTLAVLTDAARTGQPPGTRRALGRAARPMRANHLRANHWGWN